LLARSHKECPDCGFDLRDHLRSEHEWLAQQRLEFEREQSEYQQQQEEERRKKVEEEAVRQNAIHEIHFLLTIARQCCLNSNCKTQAR
jgi:hypothetical protein